VVLGQHFVMISDLHFNQTTSLKRQNKSRVRNHPAFFVCAPGRAHLFGGESPLCARQGEAVAKRQGWYREVSAEGSRRQSTGLTNRNRI